MPRWVQRVLVRVRECVRQRRVRFTHKARRELAELGLGLDQADACAVLARLRSDDAARRVISEVTGEWMYVFKPRVGEALAYVKLVLRDDCIVVSFHGQDGDEDESAN